MKELWISIHIINHTDGSHSCWMGQSVDDEPMQITELAYDKACKLMWELKLAGGEKEITIPYNSRPTLVERKVTYLLML